MLVFDQFEEIFTVYQERWQHREDLLRQLAAALDEDPELRVILSMREEYLAQLERYAGLLPDALRARFHLERLRAPAALEAVARPLTQRGVEFAPGVAERLVHDLRQSRIDVGGGRVLEVEGEFVEPVHLQVVCRTLWARLDPSVRRVTARDLAALGNVDESLARYYDDAIASVRARTSIREPKLRREIERLLITSAGTRATVFAGAKETASLPSAALDELADRHLIRAEWRAGGRWFELAHDRLIEPIRRSNAAVLERYRRRKLLQIIGAMVLLSVVGAVAVVAVSSVWFSKITVPNVVGMSSTFEAERRLQQAGLTLSPRQRERVTTGVAPGTVLDQSPGAGAKVDPGSDVILEIAISSGKVLVPSVTGVLLAKAERVLRRAGLTLGAISPEPPDPDALVVSQTPDAGQVVTEGTPVDVFVEPISEPTPTPQPR